ncbi:hypothetical protein [uncultured Amnibacterium sp.]|uniref:hypothetical protein n=1 Tax=uncultured Amnibacterium sp. TaxID=1631851 RepID=UPI0035CBBF63
MSERENFGRLLVLQQAVAVPLSLLKRAWPAEVLGRPAGVLPQPAEVLAPEHDSRTISQQQEIPA